MAHRNVGCCWNHSSVEGCIGKVRDYWSVLDGIGTIESWDEIFTAALSRAPRPDCWFQLGEVVRDLLEMVTSRGCPNWDTVSRIIEARDNWLGEPWNNRLRDEPRDPSGRWECDEYLKPLRKDVESNRARQGIGVDLQMLYRAFDCRDKQFMQALVVYGLEKYNTIVVPPPIRKSPQNREQRDIDTGPSPRPQSNEEIFYRLATNGCISIVGDRRFNGRTRLPFWAFGAIFMFPFGKNTGSGGAREVNEEMKDYATVQLMYAETLPDPAVSSDEIRDFLLLGLHDHPDVVDEMMEVFAELFGGQKAHEPRSLSHLCRCTVRDTIVQRSPVTLPAAVGSLNIPVAIKDFLLCSPGWTSRQKQYAAKSFV